MISFNECVMITQDSITSEGWMMPCMERVFPKSEGWRMMNATLILNLFFYLGGLTCNAIQDQDFGSPRGKKISLKYFLQIQEKSSSKWWVPEGLGETKWRQTCWTAKRWTNATRHTEKHGKGPPPLVPKENYERKDRWRDTAGSQAKKNMVRGPPHWCLKKTSDQRLVGANRYATKPRWSS
jgi:hypothetical protein